MTTGLSDKQLQDAFDVAAREAFERGEMHLSPPGLRAVADLAITHLEAELHGLRQENEKLKRQNEPH